MRVTVSNSFSRCSAAELEGLKQGEFVEKAPAFVVLPGFFKVRK